MLKNLTFDHILSLSKKEDKIKLVQLIVNHLDERTLSCIKNISTGKGFNAHLKILELFDLWLSEYFEYIIIPNKLSNAGTFYFAFFFPEFYIKRFNKNNTDLSSLGDTSFKRLMSRPHIPNYVYNLVINSNGCTFNSIKLLLLALSLTSKRFYETPQQERNFLCHINEIVLANADEYSGIISCIIKSRISVIDDFISSNVSLNTNRQIALFITGQSRGFIDALPNLVSKITIPSDVDVFISTWKDIGHTQLSKERICRIFDSEAAQYVSEPDSYSFVDEHYDELKDLSLSSYKNNNLEEIYSSFFSGCNSVLINIKDDGEYPYNKMSNAEKMYYHNSFWFCSLKNHNWDKYRCIIKIRPDALLQVDNVTINDIDVDDSVYCEDSNGWIFREWGFGIGDQLFYGDPDIMKKLMCVHGLDNIYSQLTSLISSSNVYYSGHINVGLCAWANVYDCKVSNLKIKNIVAPRKISLEQILSLRE